MSPNTNSPADTISMPNPLGIQSNLPPEICDIIWSHVLQHMTITHSMWTRDFVWTHRTILHCSTEIRAQVLASAKLHAIHTFPGAWHLEYYLAHVRDVRAIPHYIHLRFNSPRFCMSLRPRYDAVVRKAIADGLGAWLEPLGALPRDGFRQRTLILDISGVPDVERDDLYLSEFRKFVRLVALRERARCGGRCRVWLVGPRDLLDDGDLGEGVVWWGSEMVR